MVAQGGEFQIGEQWPGAKDLLASGLVEEIAGTPMMIAERRGRGSVILFTDNPNFRGTFFGTNKLFLNGLFFSRAFSAPRDDGRAADQDHQHQAH